MRMAGQRIAMIELLRPHQWIKNTFVLLGVLFSHQWNEPVLVRSGVAFLAFCAVASAIYILNDILDLRADRLHPVKRHRPLAAGAVSIPCGWWISCGLFTIALVMSWWVSRTAAVLILLYWLLNLAYSWRLKQVVILDVFIISAGFMLRILVGTSGLGIAPSNWLLLCGMMVTLFLGFAKRRAELLSLDGGRESDQALSRRVLDDYTPAMIDQFMAISAACTIVSYCLYTVSPDTAAFHSVNLIYTVPFVIYGIFRYFYILLRQAKGNDTANDLLSDRHLLLTVALWVGVTIWLLS